MGEIVVRTALTKKAICILVIVGTKLRTGIMLNIVSIAKLLDTYQLIVQIKMLVQFVCIAWGSIGPRLVALKMMRECIVVLDALPLIKQMMLKTISHIKQVILSAL